MRTFLTISFSIFGFGGDALTFPFAEAGVRVVDDDVEAWLAGSDSSQRTKTAIALPPTELPSFSPVDPAPTLLFVVSTTDSSGSSSVISSNFASCSSSASSPPTTGAGGAKTSKSITPPTTSDVIDQLPSRRSSDSKQK